MANPQLEKGFIQIATGKEENDILIALVKAELSGSEYQIVLYVMRKTWGFKKPEDWISLSQFERITNKSRARVCESIKALVKKNILVKNTLLGKTTKLSINKNFDEWNKVVKKSGLVKKTRLVTSKENKTQLVKNTGHTKDIYTKESMENKSSPTQDKQLNKDVTAIIDYYSTCYEGVFGSKPVITAWARYKKVAKPVVKQLGIEELKKRMDKYFITNDDWLKQNRWPLSTFFTDNTLNKLK